MTFYNKLKTVQKLNIHLYYYILTRLQWNNCTPTTHLWHGLHCHSGMWAIATHRSTERNVYMSANVIQLIQDNILSMLHPNRSILHVSDSDSFITLIASWTPFSLAYFTLRCSGMWHCAVHKLLPPMNARPHNHSSTTEPWENLHLIQDFGSLSFS